MVYGGFKVLARITASDNILREKAFNIARIPEYDGYQRGLDSMVCKFLINIRQAVVLIRANKSAFNDEKLAEELHKPIIKRF